MDALLTVKRAVDVSDLKILNKQQRITPLIPNRAQQHFMAHMTGRDIILKARQLGFSTIIQAHLFKTAMNETARIGTLAHDDETTRKLRDMQQLFYGELSDLRKPERAINNATRTYYPQTRSMVYIGTAGNTRQGRGGTYSHVHGSEVAFWKDAAQIMGGLLQGVPENGTIILESTPNGMTGWFYEQCMAALDGNSLWTLHFYPWWWDDNYQTPIEAGEVIEYTADEQALVDREGLTPEQIKWRRRKQRELGRLFPQEYPEDPYSCFLASGTSYFGDVEHVFTAPVGAPFNLHHRYVAGLDFGQSEDYTVMFVLDASDYRMVDMLRINQHEWQEMRRQISIMANKWRATVIGEANSMGKTNIELLQKGETLSDGSKIAPIQLVPFDTTPKSKPPLIQGLHHALHEMGLSLLDDAALRHEIRAFISRQLPSGHWVYEAGEGAHDDCVMALALAWYGVFNQPTSFAKSPVRNLYKRQIEKRSMPKE